MSSPPQGCSWQPPPPLSQTGKLGRIRAQPIQFSPEQVGAAPAPRFSPNQVAPPQGQQVRMGSPQRGQQQQARMNSPQPGPSWRQQAPTTLPQSPSATSPPASGRCKRVKNQPRLCTSEELRQQVEFTQKQVDMSKEALATQEKRTREDIKTTEEATKAKNAEIEKTAAEVGQLTTQAAQLTAEVAEKDAKLLTLSKASQLLAMHMREEVVEMSQAAERERVVTRQLSPHLNQISSSPDRGGGQSVQQQQQVRPNTPPPAPSGAGESRLGRIKMPAFQFPDQVVDAPSAMPVQGVATGQMGQQARPNSPPPAPRWQPPANLPTPPADDGRRGRIRAQVFQFPDQVMEAPCAMPVQPVAAGQKVRPNSPQPGPSWQQQSQSFPSPPAAGPPRWQPPVNLPTPPPPSPPFEDGRRGRIRMQPILLPDQLGDAPCALPNQMGPQSVQQARMPSPPRQMSPRRPPSPGVQQVRPPSPEPQPPRWVPPPLLPQSDSPPPPSPPGDGRCRRVKIQPRLCTSEELRQQVEFTQKQVEMTKEALAAQEQRTKEEIKKTEEATAAKNQEIEKVAAELGELNSQVEQLTTEVQVKEAELITLHTSNQIETEHMREEIVELSESADRERITREMLIPELDQVAAVLNSTPARTEDLERQYQELQSEIDYLRNSPGGACDYVSGTDMMNFENSNDMIEFEPTPDFIEMSPNFEDMIQLSPRTPQQLPGRPLNFVSPSRPYEEVRSPRTPQQLPGRPLNFVSPSKPARDTPSPVPMSQARSPSPPPPQPSPRSPNYYTNMLLNPRPPTPPPLPTYDIQQFVGPIRPRPRSAGPPPSNYPVSPPIQRSRTPPASPPLPTMAGRNNAAGQWYDEGNQIAPPACADVQQDQFPLPPPFPSGDRYSPPPASPPIRTNFNANQFNSPPIQVGNPSFAGAYEYNIPTPPPLPTYNVEQYYPGPIREPIRRPLRPVSAPLQGVENMCERPPRPLTPQMQVPNYNYNSPNAPPQFRPPTPPPLPNYNVPQYDGVSNQLRLRRNLRQRPPVNSPVQGGAGGIPQGPSTPLGIGDISGGGFGFEEIDGYDSPGLMAFSPPPRPRPATPPPIGPRDLDFVARGVPGSDSPLVPPPPAGGCCRAGNARRSPSPPPNRRGAPGNYNQQQLSVCPVGPNVDGFCPCTQMARAGPRGIGDMTPPPGFQDISFSPNRIPGELPDYILTPPGRLQDVSDNSMNFEDISMGSMGSPGGRNPNASPVLDGIMGVVPDFDGLGLDVSFSPIQNRVPADPARGIGNVTPPNVPFQDMSFESEGQGSPGIPDQGDPWLIEDGIQDISSFNYSDAPNLSFSPIQNNRRVPAGEQLDDINPPIDFQDISGSDFGSPVGRGGGRFNASSPMMGGIMGVVPDFDGLGFDVSFSPIQNRVQTPLSGGLGNVSPPPGYQDMSFGSPVPNQVGQPQNASTPVASPLGILGGIQDVSFGGLGVADMSFSPVQRRGPGRLQDMTPPAFQDISFDGAPGGAYDMNNANEINARGGLRDQSPMRFAPDMSFSPIADGGRVIAATPPPAQLSPTWRNQVTPPPYVEGEDMFQFSPSGPNLIQMSPDLMEFSPPRGGFPPGRDLPFCELRGRDFNAPISPPLPRIRPPTPVEAPPRPPSPVAPGGPLRSPPQPPPLPTYDTAQFYVTPGRRPNVPRPMYGNFMGQRLDDDENGPPAFQDMSFSPGNNEGPAPADFYRRFFGPGIDEVSDMSMNVSSLPGSPFVPAASPARSFGSPDVAGIMGVVPDFDGLGYDVSFSPIQNRARTPPSGGIGNISPPPGFQDMSFGTPAANLAGRPIYASTPLSSPSGMDGGIQDVSFGGLGVADMSFSPVQRRGPGRLQDMTPPAFQDISFDGAPGGAYDMNNANEINARGGLRDQSPMRFAPDMSFSPIADGGRVIAATPPAAQLSPTWRNQVTPPAYVEGEDMFQFSPPALMEMSPDFIRFSPRTPGPFPPGRDLPFVEMRGRDFNAPISPPLPRIRPPTPENAYAPPPPPSPVSPGGPLRSPPQPPPMPNWDVGRYYVQPGQRPNLPRPIHRNFEGAGLDDEVGNSPPQFHEISFSPQRERAPSPGAVERAVYGLNAPGIMEESGFSMNFNDVSMTSSRSAPSPGQARNYDGIMGEDSNFGFDQANMSFSPIRIPGRAPQPSPPGIANMTAPSYQGTPEENSFDEFAIFASPPNRNPVGAPIGASTPLQSPSWGMDEGILEQSTFYDHAPDMSFSPIVMNRGGRPPRPVRRLEEITPPDFQEISFGTPQAHMIDFNTPPRTPPGPSSPGACARTR